MTPEYAHLLTAARRTHNSTEQGVSLEGRGSCGKSALVRLYRQLNHQNSFYLTVSSRQSASWVQKVGSTLHQHGLNLLGARINYKETIIMVEDLHLYPSESQSLLSLELMLNYKKWQAGTGQLSLRNVKFLLTGQYVPDSLQTSTTRLYLGTGLDQLKSIFG